ncbi:MAG: MBL fold metallo-hydrolase [Woeseiaceae bacterium]
MKSIAFSAAVLSFAAVAPVTAPAQGFDDVDVRVHPVAGRVSYIEGRGGNIGLLAGDDGVILIDDQFAPLTERIVAAVRTVSDKPIRFIVNTHLHPDHTGGNENLGKLGAVVFGHDNVRIQMELSGYAEQPPLVTFSDDLTFHMDGETVQVFKTPDAHTNGDSFIRFLRANVVHTGDVYRTTTYPYIDTDNGGSFLGTIRALDLLIGISNGETRIIPGHGVLSNVAEVRAVRDMLLVIRDRVIAGIAAGKSLEELTDAGLTEEFDARWASETRIGSPAELLRAAWLDLGP